MELIQEVDNIIEDCELDILESVEYDLTGQLYVGQNHFENFDNDGFLWICKERMSLQKQKAKKCAEQMDFCSGLLR
ncbi:hypothetical protein Trydic_g10466 [Trypoxylus dichotomus]